MIKNPLKIFEGIFYAEKKEFVLTKVNVAHENI